MAADPACPPPDAGPPAGFDARLATARAAVAELAGAVGDLAELDGDALAPVMRELTTLAGQIDGLRVAVTAQVRERGIFRQQGAANVNAWLRADPRVADEAWALSQLAARTGELPKITGLLRTGAASLAQAGAACWQIAHLPDTVTRPQGDDDLAALTDPQPGDDLWRGLWRAGDVHAAADELFSEYLSRMDGAGLRMLGAHLREAADAQERAGEDYDAFARRAVRLSRSLGGVGELSGRLHPEAAGQVLAAFEELGGKAGPDDDRTKVQRWADVLVYLASLAGISPAATSPADSSPPGADPADLAPASPAPADLAPVYPAPAAAGSEPHLGAQDDQPAGDAGHGHEAQPPGGLPAGLRLRPRVIVTVPLATLLGRPLAPGAVLGAGIPITAETARRLACDAEIVRLITGQPSDPGPPGDPGQPSDPGPPRPGDDGAVGKSATGQLTELLAAAIGQLPRPLGGPSAALDIGRASQSWTPRQRDALYALYGGRCGAPGCTRPIDVIHHIIHWLHGGKTKISNGMPFCGFDHWRVHEGGWRLSPRPDGSVLMLPPPAGWRPGTIYRRGKPLPDSTPTAG